MISIRKHSKVALNFTRVIALIVVVSLNAWELSKSWWNIFFSFEGFSVWVDLQLHEKTNDFRVHEVFFSCFPKSSLQADVATAEKLRSDFLHSLLLKNFHFSLFSCLWVFIQISCWLSGEENMKSRHLPFNISPFNKHKIIFLDALFTDSNYVDFQLNVNITFFYFNLAFLCLTNKIKQQVEYEKKKNMRIRIPH